jgi:hypothetical protein
MEGDMSSNTVGIVYQTHTRGSIYAHPNGPTEPPSVEIIALLIDGREQDMNMVPATLIEAAEAYALAVEIAKEDACS